MYVHEYFKKYDLKNKEVLIKDVIVVSGEDTRHLINKKSSIIPFGLCVLFTEFGKTNLVNNIIKLDGNNILIVCIDKVYLVEVL